VFLSAFLHRTVRRGTMSPATATVPWVLQAAVMSSVQGSPNFTTVRKPLLVALIAIAGAGGVIAGALLRGVLDRPSDTRTSSNAKSGTAQPESHKVVHALGRLEPGSRILELASESGNEGATVSQIFVEEGDSVSEGTVLAVFDNLERRKARLSEAKARLDAASAKLEQVRSGARAGDIAAQRAVLALAQQQSQVALKELARARELHERKAISAEELDSRQWALDRLKIEQQRAQGTLESLQEVRPTDVQAAAMEVEACRAAVDVAQAELEASSLKAPRDGRILRIHTRPGEKITSDGIMELGDVEHMHAVAEVFEADIDLIRNGQFAEIVMDGSGTRLTGVVVDVGQMVARKIVLTNDPVSDTDARVVEVRIALDAQWSRQVARLSNARIEAFIQLDTPQKLPADPPQTTSTN